MARLKIRANAATLLENLVALAILSVCISLSLSIVSMIQSNQKKEELLELVRDINLLKRNTEAHVNENIGGLHLSRVSRADTSQFYKYPWILSKE